MGQGSSGADDSQATAAETATRQMSAAEIIKFLEPKPALYCPEKPSITQKVFMRTNAREALFGGMAGGGKSSALLMGAMQYVDIPGYAAILFRRTFADLTQPGALMDRFKQWIGPENDVHWNENTYTATFPSGAKITFGYLNNPNDRYRYQGIEVQYCGFDELTQLREEDYRYLTSRLRRPKHGPLAQVPLRMRGATNPAPNWVRQRFIIEGKDNGRIFIPSSMEDNPGVDTESYKLMLAELDPVERRRLEFGDWFAATTGSMFDRTAFVELEPTNTPTMITTKAKFVRFWDLAATDPSTSNPDPDWTVGTLMLFDEGIAYVLDVVRLQARSEIVEKTIAQTAQRDGRNVPIRMEQEPGSSGKSMISHYARHIVTGYDFQGIRSSGDKVTRARPFAAAVANGNVRLAPGTWRTPWIDELTSFPEGMNHDDQVDSATGAFNFLTGLGGNGRKRIGLIV